MNKYICNEVQERVMSSTRPDSKVVQLYKEISPGDISNAEDAINLAKTIREDLSDDITEVVMEQFMGWLTSYGIFSRSEKFNAKDIIMIENAVAGALYRYYGISHPIHEMVDEVIKMGDEAEEDVSDEVEDKEGEE